MPPDFSPDLNWIDAQQDAMLDRVVAWCSVNSGSANLAGLSRMLGLVEDAFAQLGAAVERLDLPPHKTIDDAGETVERRFGQTLRFTKHPEADRKVFLCIHMDTVFGEGDAFQAVERVDDNTLRGPGVADAKGGLVVMLTALQALERSAVAGRIGWEVLINSDEEVGSLGSDALIAQGAKDVDMAMLYEPALPDGTLVGARKGSGNFAVVVHGRAAHAGRDFHEGRNALTAMASLVTQLDALNSPKETSGGGLTLNVGKITGGGAVNIVPELAVMRYNVRYETEDQRQRVEQAAAAAMERINNSEGFTAEHYGSFSAPPKSVGQASQAMQGIVERCAAELGIGAVNWRSTGGVCDGNRTAGLGVATIDTLGVRGGAIHSDQEFLLIDSLAERAKLSALMLLKLASGEAEWPGRDGV